MMPRHARTATGGWRICHRGGKSATERVGGFATLVPEIRHPLACRIYMLWSEPRKDTKCSKRISHEGIIGYLVGRFANHSANPSANHESATARGQTP